MFGWRRSSRDHEADRQREYEAARQLSVQLPFADDRLPDSRMPDSRMPDDRGPDDRVPAFRPEAAAEPPLDDSDPGVRLARLGQLRDQGLMSDEEYTARRRRIFDA